MFWALLSVRSSKTSDNGLKAGDTSGAAVQIFGFFLEGHMSDVVPRH